MIAVVVLEQEILTECFTHFERPLFEVNQILDLRRGSVETLKVELFVNFCILMFPCLKVLLDMSCVPWKYRELSEIDFISYRLTK